MRGKGRREKKSPALFHSSQLSTFCESKMAAIHSNENKPSLNLAHQKNCLRCRLRWNSCKLLPVYSYFVFNGNLAWECGPVPMGLLLDPPLTNFRLIMAKKTKKKSRCKKIKIRFAVTSCICSLSQGSVCLSIFYCLLVLLIQVVHYIRHKS